MRDYVEVISDVTLIKPKTVLEIGSRDANDAEYLRDAFSIKNEDVHIVEPNPEMQDLISKKYPNFNLYKVAISNQVGKLDFYKVDSKNGMDQVGRSSLLNRNDNLYNKIDSDVIKVDAITGKTLLEQIKNDSIDLCKIDVEGLTYEVIESFEDSILKIKSFHIEAEHKQFWEGQKLYKDLVGLFIRKGYAQIYFKFVWGGVSQSDSVWVHPKYLK